MRRLAIMAGAALAGIIGHGAAEVTMDQLARRQAAQPKRGDQRRLTRGAANDLALAGHATLVLGHIHPRWLRTEVERRMDAGEDIDAERVEQLRAIGAGRA